MERKTTSFGMDRRTLVAGMAAVPAFAFTRGTFAQQNQVTAIDIALEPDATMAQRAKDETPVCSSLSSKAFRWMRRTTCTSVSCSSLSARTTLTRYRDGERDYGQRKAHGMNAQGVQVLLHPDPPFGLAGIVAEPTDDLYRMQDELITAVESYTVKTGTPAASFSEAGGRDIQKSLIEYVTRFVRIAAGKTVQFACNDRRRSGKISERDACGAIPVVHVIAGRRVGLSARHLRAARKELKVLTLAP